MVAVAFVTVALKAERPPVKVEDACEISPPFARMVLVLVGARLPCASNSNVCPNVFPPLAAIPKEDVATKSYPPTALPKSTWPYVGAVEVPVPPFVIPSTPETSVATFTNPVETTPAAARKTPVSEPMRRLVVDAVTAERLVVDALPNVWSAVNTFAVYVFGTVDDAPTNAFTLFEKSEICDEVSVRFESVVIDATEVVAAKLEMKLLVARAGVK